MSMAPSEYIGDVGTCVYGRVVLIRSPFTPEAQKVGKEKRGSNKTALRRRSRRRVRSIFMEGWADGAAQMYKAVLKR